MSEPVAVSASAAPTAIDRLIGMVRLARPLHWVKGVFVFFGPLYALADNNLRSIDLLWSAFFTFLAFGACSSACYAVNDLRDAALDRQHPRKKRRPVASGLVSTGGAIGVTVVMLALSATLLLGVTPEVRGWVGLCIAIYAVNTMTYSVYLKRVVTADVISLAMGFVLRVVAGCFAVGVAPSTFLLNVVFFLAMFLAFGKRLGERRTLGSDGAAKARAVQAGYTDEILRLSLVATAVVTLVSYAAYVLSRDAAYAWRPTWMAGAGFNLLWITLLPATYGLLRCVQLIERGRYDDPTELAFADRPFQLAGIAFVGATALLMWMRKTGQL
jgi:decaprenyl-phosphate phosphoribosyltransferase